MRLDVWLVKHGFFSSRQRAKKAIMEGKVLVNGRVRKQSTRVQEDDVIRVLDWADRPRGYHKLMAIEESLGFPLVEPGMRALDIGSSAGGFLLFLHERGAYVTGIEFSTEFMRYLSKIVEFLSRATLVHADAFKINPLSVAAVDSLDLLLVDVTCEPTGTLNLLTRFWPLLRLRGRFLAAFKMSYDSSVVRHIEDSLFHIGASNTRVIILDKSRDELHIYGEKKQVG